MLTSNDFGSTFDEQLSEDGTVTATFILAVTSDREVALPGKCGEEIQKPGRVRLVHLGAELALEYSPRLLIARSKDE
jgi:hypothetical protein